MLIAFSLVCFLGWFYLQRRLLRPLALKPSRHLPLALIMLVMAELPLIIALASGGNYAAATLPRWGALAFNWAFGAMVLLFFLVLLRDLLRLLLAFICRPATWQRSITVATLLSLAAAGLSAFGVWQAVKPPAVKSVTLTFPGLPAAFDGYRIVQLSDLHASDLLPAHWQQQVVETTNALQPDLIVITGDLQDGKPATRQVDLQPLRQLSAKDGVIAVPGNHEYYVDYNGWMTVFRQLGLDVLENQHRLITRDDSQLAIIGLTDRQARAFHLPPPNIEQAMASLPANSFRILLSHQPNSAVANARHGIDLELAGHTHGGQVLGLHWITQWANKGYVSGRYQVGNMQLYVNNGTGLWSGFALRLGKPSEITNITLRR